MKLTLDGHSHDFTPIKAFRAKHNLPLRFGVSLFEPKDYTGLGRIDNAGTEMNALRSAVLTAVPSHIPLPDLVQVALHVAAVFRAQLYAINNAISLRPAEVEFAYAGVADVTQAYAYALLHAHLAKSTPPAFERVYHDWLQSSARVAQTAHIYQHGSAVWQVQIVNHAYGRAGMIVQDAGATYYVADTALACPAEGYMATLLAEICAALTERLQYN
ncbi:MAG: hypothetical protein SF123_07475 [Chloroflexota bacterium]|nr:hypothetical protein [Chloroflexota bacterium]